MTPREQVFGQYLEALLHLRHFGVVVGPFNDPTRDRMVTAISPAEAQTAKTGASLLRGGSDA